jgi:hypothetical protein
MSCQNLDSGLSYVSSDRIHTFRQFLRFWEYLASDHISNEQLFTVLEWRWKTWASAVQVCEGQPIGHMIRLVATGQCKTRLDSEGHCAVDAGHVFSEREPGPVATKQLDRYRRERERERAWARKHWCIHTVMNCSCSDPILCSCNERKKAGQGPAVSGINSGDQSVCVAAACREHQPEHRTTFQELLSCSVHSFFLKQGVTSHNLYILVFIILWSCFASFGIDRMLLLVERL